MEKKIGKLCYSFYDFLELYLNFPHTSHIAQGKHINLNVLYTIYTTLSRAIIFILYETKYR